MTEQGHELKAFGTFLDVHYILSSFCESCSATERQTSSKIETLPGGKVVFPSDPNYAMLRVELGQ